jgi:glycopeptide antibiotics resistance protein
MTSLKWCCIVAYTITVIFVVFFAPRRARIPPTARRVYIIPFQNTVRSYYSLQSHSLHKRVVFFVSNFLGNILLLAPLCYLIFWVTGGTDIRIIIIGGIALSVLIEIVQYTLSIGIFDIDDVILNSAGVFLGSYLGKKSFTPKTLKKS